MSPDRDDSTPTEGMPPVLPSRHERFLPGTVLASRFRIVALSGRGGMGEVYRADDLKIGQPVALKFLPADLERDPDRLRRLLDEVRIARQVSHPNVCRVYDIVEFEGHHFITMEFVDGEDLAALLRRIGRLPQEKALDLARQIGAGLAAAHVQGIVHRDLKPANIMIDGRGRARITDFGLAAAAEAVRGAEARWGTPAYMAPEQVAGGEITSRTDVYALGLVLFEMFSGRSAFEGAPASDRGSRPEGAPVRPSSLVPGLEPAIDTAILKCIENDPARRPGSAVAFLALLPGGDLLEAALRAGETPSPQMVAAADSTGTLSTAKALGLFSLALVVTAAAIFFSARVSGLDEVPMTRSPDVLRERALQITRQLGDDVAPRSIEWWFNQDAGFAEWSLRQPHAPTLASARPSAIRFNFRQSAVPILPTGPGRLTRWNPGLTRNGDAFLALDPDGRLLELSRIARQFAPDDSSPAPPAAWGPLLALTGADAGALREVKPLWTPDVPCDARAAWIANDSGQAIRLEAAAWRGKPVWLRTIGAWTRAERDSSAHPLGYTGFAFFVAFTVTMLLVMGALARHNLRLGRGDKRGALRVAMTVFLLFGIAISLDYRWALEPAQLWRWLWMQPYLPAFSLWLFYLGVEPYLRRRWPHRLIAWTRLLEGGWADPLVGRELLLGSLAGAGAALANCIPAVLERHRDVAILVSALPLGRGMDFWSSIPDTLGDGMMRGLGAFAVLLLLRVLLRREIAAWVGLGFTWMLIGLPSWNIPVAEWAGIALSVACLIFAVRVGIVASVVATAVSELVTFCAPMTLDFSRWYAWRTGVIAALLFALAAWGFRSVMGRRQLLSEKLLEG